MDATTIRAAYDNDGLVRLPGAFPPEVAVELAARVRSAGRLAELRRSDAFAPIGTPLVRDAIHAILGDIWREPSDWGGALVTEPTAGTWQTPSGGWHLDYPVRGAPRVELHLKWLAYLDPVAHGGGATLVIARSHQLVADWA